MAIASGVEAQKKCETEAGRIMLQLLVFAQHDHWKSVLVPVTSTTAQYFSSFDHMSGLIGSKRKKHFSEYIIKYFL